MKGTITCDNCGITFEWVAYQNISKDSQNDGDPKNIDFVFLRDNKYYCYIRCPKCLKRKEIEMENQIC